jgi:hypothetical protein
MTTLHCSCCTIVKNIVHAKNILENTRPTEICKIIICTLNSIAIIIIIIIITTTITISSSNIRLLTWYNNPFFEIERKPQY